jgi:hypothetical protein
MPSIEQIRNWADDFEKAYPEELPERLRWFVEVLGVGQNHLLRLMGVVREEVERLAEGGLDWRWAVKQFGEDRAWWAESVIRQAIVFYHYDWPALKERLARPLDKEFEVALPGGQFATLGSLPAERRESILLDQVAGGGPQATLALIAYLSQPESALVGS